MAVILIALIFDTVLKSAALRQAVRPSVSGRRMTYGDLACTCRGAATTPSNRIRGQADRWPTYSSQDYRLDPVL